MGWVPHDPPNKINNHRFILRDFKQFMIVVVFTADPDPSKVM